LFVFCYLTLISSLTIGIPGFFLALAPNATRAQTGFLGRVLRFAIPAGVVAAGGTFAGYLLTRVQTDSLTEAQTTAVIVLFIIAFWVLGMLARPYNGWRTVLIGAMAGLFVLALAIPMAREFFDLALPPLDVLVEALVLAGVGCVLLEAGLRLAHWRMPATFSGVGGGAFARPGQQDTD